MMYRFTGHETFPCRYPWLPKAVAALQNKSDLFRDIDEAIVKLGVGKQMARAIRFWVEAAKVVEKKGRGDYEVNLLGQKLLGKDGYDPYLENLQTLWLIHWNFSNHPKNPIFAWDFLMNQWHEPEIASSLVVAAFQKEAKSQSRKLSPVTLKQHFNIFLHTYVPTQGTKGNILEDNLDCPLIELDLIRQIGERVLDEQTGKREMIYDFNRDSKPKISQQLFAYCLNNFWEIYHRTDQTLPFSEVSSGRGSPGQIFKLPEQEIRTRLEGIEEVTEGGISFSESVNLRQVQKQKDIDCTKLLNAIYEEPILWTPP